MPTKKEYYLGVDLGGTSVRVGIISGDGEISHMQKIDANAHRPAAEICDDIAALCKSVLQSAGLTVECVPWVGVGSAGLVRDGKIEYATNLNICGAPLRDMLTERLNKRVLFENDANAAALGEHIAGAGKGKSSLAMITIGTGIGGGIILDGKIHKGFNGFAGEIGHTVIKVDGRECTCGDRGCLEAYCSAKSLKKITGEAMRKDASTKLHNVMAIEKPSVKALFAIARMGDKCANSIVEEFLHHLSIGILNIINFLQPEVICISGGIAGEGESLCIPLRKLVYDRMLFKNPALYPTITTGQLGSDAGLVGAALLGLQG